MRLTVGSLFSGIGGFDLGLERAGMRVEWQVENNEFCREVLKKHWPQVPCHYDITKIDWRDIPRVDLVCGGFPCQPFSLAGKQRGESDDRYLWPEVVRCLDTLRPTWFIGENVPGIINLALDQVCIDLESLSYAVWPVCIPACAVDAPHVRQRVWIMAHSHAERESQPQGVEQKKREWALNSGEDVADADAERWDGRTGQQRTGRGEKLENVSRWISEPELGRVVARLSPRMDGGGLKGDEKAVRQSWLSEPVDIPRVATGVKNRVDRLRGLGNAVVPQVVEALGRMIVIENENMHT
ncbi:MAG: DNA cytosine methyltransferase [Burkholderiales bacterium]